VGCARTTVSPEQQYTGGPLPRPQMVLVYDFAYSSAQITANGGILHKALVDAQGTTVAEQDQEIGSEVANTMANKIAAGINGLGLQAMIADSNAPVPPNSVIVTGEFIDIDEGNRLRRLVIGFGTGQSKLDTQIRVLAPVGGTWQTVTEFTTHSDSGDMPGAAVTMGAGAAAQGAVTAEMAAANAAVGGVKAYRTAMGPMAAKSADDAVKYLAKFFASQGWISSLEAS
jgi:Domain of unknown function (DUF4410)